MMAIENGCGRIQRYQIPDSVNIDKCSLLVISKKAVSGFKPLALLKCEGCNVDLLRKVTLKQ